MISHSALLFELKARRTYDSDGCFISNAVGFNSSSWRVVSGCLGDTGLRMSLVDLRGQWLCFCGRYRKDGISCLSVLFFFCITMPTHAG